jgi:hypothetical protein
VRFCEDLYKVVSFNFVNKEDDDGETPYIVLYHLPLS